MIKLTFGFSLFCSNVLSKNIKQKCFFNLKNAFQSYKPSSVTKCIRFSQLFCLLPNGKCQNNNANFLSNETNWIGEINLISQSPFFRHGNVI